jgi:Putative zinc-finger
VNHLGRWLSALVDGELDGSERDRVLNHLARCEPCRQEANALRALKRRMTALGDDAADTTIAGRLIELARSDADLVGSQVRSPWSGSWAAPAVTGPSWGRSQSRAGWMLAAGSAGLAVTALGAAAFLLGGAPPTPEPRITPAVEVFWQQHGYDTGQVPAAPPRSTGSGVGSGLSGPGLTASATAAPGSAGNPAARPRPAISPSVPPGTDASPTARPGWASSPSARPGPGGGPTAPAAVFRYSP